MAVTTRVKSITEFTFGLSSGPLVVYLDVAIGDHPPRRLHVELLDEELPYTSGNFRMLCTGERKGNAKGGDITHGNGVGGASAYSRVFEDESFLYKHQLGSISMAHQNNSNKSQFFISFAQASWCDGKHVVFGQVLAEDLDHLRAIEALGSSSGLPQVPVVVVDCGQLSGDGYMPSTAATAPTPSTNIPTNP